MSTYFGTEGVYICWSYNVCLQNGKPSLAVRSFRCAVVFSFLCVIWALWCWEAGRLFWYTHIVVFHDFALYRLMIFGLDTVGILSICASQDLSRTANQPYWEMPLLRGRWDECMSIWFVVCLELMLAVLTIVLHVENYYSACSFFYFMGYLYWYCTIKC
jgi:hypothetical protein